MNSATLLLASALSLSGTEWVTITPSAQTLKFDNGALSSFTGCNSCVGEYKQTQDKLVLNIVALTGMACLDEAMMSGEHDWLDATRQVLWLKIENEKLLLKDADGKTLIVMKRK